MAAAADDANPQGERVVDATNRGIDDLDLGVWIAFTGATCFARTALQHPFVLACARRQACEDLARVSSWALLRDFRRAHGGSWRVMYRGFPALAFGMVTSEIVYMWAYEWLRNPSGPSPLAQIAPSVDGAPSSHFLDASAGFAADASTTIGQVPFFFIANRQMCAGLGSARGVPYMPAGAVLRDAMRRGGPSVVFAGLSASLLLSTHSAFWWSAYQDAKSRLYPMMKPELEALAAERPWLPSPIVSTSDNMPINCFAAVAAGTVVAVVWNPASVLRTRMQLAAAGANPAPRLRDVARGIWQREGARGFMKGTCMAVVGTAVDVCAFTIFYELGKQLAQRSPA